MSTIEQGRLSRRRFLHVFGLGVEGITLSYVTHKLNTVFGPFYGWTGEAGTKIANSETLQWISDRKAMIWDCCQQYGIPPGLLASIVYRENVGGFPILEQTAGELMITWRDVSISQWERDVRQAAAFALKDDSDVSVGIASVKVWRARELEDRLVKPETRRQDLTLEQRQAMTIARLSSTWWNLAYAAYYIRTMLDKLGVASWDVTATVAQEVAGEYNGSGPGGLYAIKVAEYYPFFCSLFHQWYEEYYTGKTFRRADLSSAVRIWDWSPNLGFLYMAEHPVKYLVVHHTASPDSTPIGIWFDHTVSKGWGNTGYHGIIDSEGNLYAGRPSSQIGVHAPPHNGDSLGFAGIGNWSQSRPTEPQMRMFSQTLAACSIMYGLPLQDIVGHREVTNSKVFCGTARCPDTECPGSLFDMDELREHVDSFVYA